MEIYLVGGAVRDELLGVATKDLDYVVVGAEPAELVAKGFTQVGKDFPVFLHPETKAEYALARTERKAGQGYTGFTCYAAPDVTLEQDLARRDLTINAIAKSQTGELIDPYGGIDDIKHKQLRHVSPAFSEDPLRVLRLARFAARLARFGFTIAPETWQLASAMVASGELSALVRERVWQELSQALCGPNPEVFLNTLQALHAWPHLLPVSPSFEADFQAFEGLQQDPCEQLECRYSLLVDAFAQALTSRAISQALKVPNSCAECAQLTQSMRATQHDLQHSDVATHANTLLQLLKRADPIRRPQRWQTALSACLRLQQVQPLACPPSILTVAATAYCNVDAGEFTQQGLSGAEIGKALTQARLLAIRQALNSEN